MLHGTIRNYDFWRNTLSVRALMTLWKSKIGVVSRVISATESESEDYERFYFLPTSLYVIYQA